MNKRIIYVTLLVVVIISILCLFTGCKVVLDESSGYELMKNAIEESIKYDVYYWKQFENIDGKIELVNVNVHCDSDNNGLVLDNNGKYKNFATRIEKTIDKNKILEQYCGDSKSSKGEKTMSYLINKNYEKGLHVNSSKEIMSPFDYIDSYAFEPYRISSKLEELSLLNHGDIDFNVKGGEIYKNGTVIVLKGKVKEEFLSRYKAEYGRDSMFLGEQLEVEISYGRIAKIVVYQKEVLDSNFSNLYETYKFELVYLGKNIWVPSYDHNDMKFVN